MQMLDTVNEALQFKILIDLASYTLKTANCSTCSHL